MMDWQLIEDKLKEMMTAKRFEHSLGVRDSAVHLAKKYKGDVNKAALAGLVHDCAKDLSTEKKIQLAKVYDLQLDEVSIRQPELIHGPLGAYMAHELFGIEDEEVLNAIRYHTTGRANMTLLEKIIYLADFIEPNREYPYVNKLRKAAEEDLDKALILSFDESISSVLDRGMLLHLNTILARNYLIIHSKNETDSTE